MNPAKGIIVFLLCLLIFVPGTSRAEYSIEAQVDKTEVSYGESFTLLITISQEIGMGGTSRMMTPNIQEIPGFDIASSRTGQSTSYINGYGQAKSQVVYELVPREAGKKTIPAFSFKDPEGKMHSTEAIEITVLPQKEEETEEASSTSAADNESGAGKSTFKGLLYVGIIFAILVAMPFVLSAIFTRNQKPSTRWQEETPAKSGKSSGIVDAEIVEVKPIKPAPQKKKIEFLNAVSELKRKFPDVNNEFYGQYFAIFKQAAIGKSQALSEDMTPDELLEKIASMNPSTNAKQAAARVAKDIEMVMYAGGIPSRSFSVIDEDLRTLLAGID